MRIQIALAESRDLPAWLRLAEEVVPLFGAMPNFEAVLKQKIVRKQAFCAHVESNGLDFGGGVLIGESGNEHWIRWLAVSSRYRRIGIARLLIEEVLNRAPDKCQVFVDTFVSGSPGSTAAQHLYKSLGFEPIGFAEIDGSSRERFRLTTKGPARP